jgi:hypothetical protein
MSYNINAIEIIQKDDKILNIYLDECPPNPREWDNLAKFCLSHKRYNLPNELNINFEEKINLEEIKKTYGIEILFIVHAYDHSGLSISLSNEYPFDDVWDSGVLGFICVTKEGIKKEFGKLTKNNIKKAEQILKYEFETYKQYVEGSVYCYTITQEKKCLTCGNVENKVLDSCSGFFGEKGIKQIKEETGF